MMDFRLSNNQFDRLMRFLYKLVYAIDNHRRRTTEGFAQVAKAISKLEPPELPQGNTAVKGTLLMRYRFNEDQTPVSFELEVKDLRSAKGSPVGAQGIELSAESSSEQLQVEVGPTVLSEDGNSCTAPISITGGSMPTTELVTVTYHAKNTDTGSDVAGDSDEFVTGPGEPTIGTIGSPVPLTEIPE
jgi:hypothetical protein